MPLGLASHHSRGVFSSPYIAKLTGHAIWIPLGVYGRVGKHCSCIHWC
ncbi:hypothetical protein SLEP1_g1318 [Rubroshorea leprosula]|uniref:Uncharacterized protein n=1 Tax=Rubroshorea leprosula TaxID=152421 RepID=A0AAV5HDF6_9ROSI|nr:hypothetical protein SLEP1_g1318 [Rubroshorea leprosula]